MTHSTGQVSLVQSVIISIIIHILCAISLHVGGTIEFTVVHFSVHIYSPCAEWACVHLRALQYTQSVFWLDGIKASKPGFSFVRFNFVCSYISK